MAAKNLAIADNELSELLSHYSLIYLKQYWPELPDSPVGWADNAVLMLAYQEAALAVQRHFKGRPLRMLDVSTGPALAPLLAMATCVSEVQLSDYYGDNRRCLQNMPIEYWKNYVPMLIKIFNHPEKKATEILALLDKLRSARVPVEVDLFRDPPFPVSVKPHEYELISMQFVADAITENEKDFLRCLGRITDMVAPGSAFIMSAAVDCSSWQLGQFAQPSPNISEKTIVDFLASQNFEILNLSRSMRHAGLAYSGGWIVLSALRSK